MSGSASAASKAYAPEVPAVRLRHRAVEALTPTLHLAWRELPEARDEPRRAPLHGRRVRTRLRDEPPEPIVVHGGELRSDQVAMTNPLPRAHARERGGAARRGSADVGAPMRIEGRATTERSPCGAGRATERGGDEAEPCGAPMPTTEKRNADPRGAGVSHAVQRRIRSPCRPARRGRDRPPSPPSGARRSSPRS